MPFYTGHVGQNQTPSTHPEGEDVDHQERLAYWHPVLFHVGLCDVQCRARLKGRCGAVL